MKVLHLTPNYPTPEYPIFGIFVKEQIESLEQIGVDCEVFYCDGKGKGMKQYLTYIPQVWWHILTNKYDIIHCHHALSAVLLCLTGWPLLKKCVLSYQNDPQYEWGDRVYKLLNLVFNKFIVKNRSSYLSNPKFVYLPNGCNQDFFKPMNKSECRELLGWSEKKKYLIYMDSNKGVRSQKRKDRFEEVITILRNKYGYDVEMVVMRNVRRELIPTYFNAADLHLISSDFEGSPNSVKECMCCNTPVVSTPVGNVREMIGDIEGAYVTETFDANELAEACDKVLQSNIPFDGRQKFLDKGYGMAFVAEKLKNIYKEII